MTGTDDEKSGSLEDGVEWPVELEGATETVVTTLGPNDRWNAAALGLFAESSADGQRTSEHEPGEDAAQRGNDDVSQRGNDEAGRSHGADADSHKNQIRARTWGNTRTRRNFHRRGEGYVQFTRDPRDFADAALSIYELEEPILESADAWVRVSAERIDAGTDDGTQWEDWKLRPFEATVEKTTVPTIDRGFAAVIEATVAASRLDVPGYDESTLRDRLEHCASVVDRAGSDRDQEALSRIREHTAW